MSSSELDFLDDYICCMLFLRNEMLLDEGREGSVAKMLWFCKPGTELDKRGERAGEMRLFVDWLNLLEIKWTMLESWHYSRVKNGKHI